MSESLELHGLTALITGGTRRIGFAIAEECARAGANVVMNYVHDEARAAKSIAIIEARAGRAIAVQADVRDARQVDEMVGAAVTRFGGVDILVNSAAIRPHCAFPDLSLSAWQDVLSVILDGAYNCVQACAPYLIRSGRGAIVNMGGLMAELGNARAIHVSAGKSGLIGLTRALAQHFGPLGVTVNCVTPGSIVADDDDDDEERRGRAEAASNIPMRRCGTPQDVASVVRAIVGPGFRFFTGQNVHLNGGSFMA